jgi:hypothetical protein
MMTDKERAMPPDLYVGVAGITTRAEADAVLAAIPPGFPRRVALGVLASAKTLAGGERNARSARIEHIGGIFSTDPRALNLLHYFTRTTGPALVAELRNAAYFGQGLCHGLQLNITWPDPVDLRIFLASLRHRARPRLVLQLGPAALEAVDWNMHALVDRLSEYVIERAISDVLIDASGGNGRSFEDSKAASLVRAIPILRAAFPDLGIGIAGGLSPQRLPNRSLLDGVSIDVESGVRDACDALHLGKVHAFLARCGELLGKEGV